MRSLSLLMNSPLPQQSKRELPSGCVSLLTKPNNCCCTVVDNEPIYFSGKILLRAVTITFWFWKQFLIIHLFLMADMGLTLLEKSRCTVVFRLKYQLKNKKNKKKKLKNSSYVHLPDVVENQNILFLKNFFFFKMITYNSCYNYFSRSWLFLITSDLIW